MQKIAVIGLSCLFPGAHTPEQFLDNLNRGIDTTTPHTEAQMGADPALYFSNKKSVPDKYYSVRGGYISDFNFDASGYALDASLLRELDDVYQWSLYVAREALKNGGVWSNREKLSGCGAILGNLSFPTKRSNRLFLPLYQQPIESSLQQLLGTDTFKFKQASSQATHINNAKISGFPSAILANALELSEIFFSLDAACASSLYAVKLACDYLNSGMVDLMLAGAVSAGDPFFINQGFSTFTAYSEQDISCPLDKRTEGLISGEGAGMLLLKRYDEAVRDKDKIYAVISGIGLSNDGKGRSVLSPNSKGQLLAFERAYQDSEVRPEQIDYIECHATGTHLGDLTELESLDMFFGKYQASPLIGAVKANFGHLLTCAGMASMLKVILSMSQAKVPATIHVQEPVSSSHGVIASDQVVNRAIDWPQRSHSKFAAVNAFGFGGTNAHLIFEERSEPSEVKPEDRRELVSMAIVGMDACFGPFSNLASLNHALYSGQHGFIPLPEQRWNGLQQDKRLLEENGFHNQTIPSGAYLSDFDFDVLRYKIPPNEIEAMMPQQMLMLKIADNAIRDAKLRVSSHVAVIVAMESDKSLHQFRGRIDLERMIDQAVDASDRNLSAEDEKALKDIAKDSIRQPVQVNEFTSFIGNIMASRISALWDFTGPSFTISADENSVYKALQVAQLMLDTGEVAAVVVGAVDLAGNLEDVLVRNRFLHVYGEGDVATEFDAAFDGIKAGEGAGAVILKRATQAAQDNNHPYAHIDAVSLMRQGDQATIGENFLNTLKQIGKSVSDVELLELSGLGVKASVLPALAKVTRTAADQTCALGSVSANIGHTYTACGMASLIKTALALYHRYIPATPVWNGLKTDATLDKKAFYVATESRYWVKAQDTQRIAAINGISTDGSIAQLILSEDNTPRKRVKIFSRQNSPLLFAFTGHDKTTLLANLSSFSEKVQASDDLYKLACQHHATAEDPERNKYNAVLIGADQETILGEIKSIQKGVEQAFAGNGDWNSPLGSYVTANPLGNKGSLAFVYPGAFNSYLGMGRELFQLFPELVDYFATYTSFPDRFLADRLLFPRSLEPITTADMPGYQKLLESDALAVFESGINLSILNTAAVMGAFGIKPDSAFGYSMGEVSMAYALGIWRNTDHMSETLHKTPLFLEQLAGPMTVAREAWGISDQRQEPIWSSYIVHASAEEVSHYLGEVQRVYLLLINSPHEVIIGGEAAACKQLIDKMPFRAGISTLQEVIHCDLVEKVRQQVYDMQYLPVSQQSAVKIYSAAHYQETAQTSRELAENIASIYCRTLDFPRLVNTVYENGSRIFLEVGPQANCSRWIDSILAEREHLTVALDQKGASTQQSLFKSLAKLISHGVTVDLSSIYPAKSGISKGKSREVKLKLGGESILSAIFNEDNKARFQNKSRSGGVSSAQRREVKPNAERSDENASNKTTDLVSAIDLQVEGHQALDQIRPVDQQVLNHQNQISHNQLAFLEARNAALKHLGEMIKLKIMLSADMPVSVPAEPITAPFQGDPYLYPESRTPRTGRDIIWEEKDLLEFAGGKIANVFGEAYQIIDTYKYRVRLPLPPYLLVNRVTELEAKRGEYKPSKLTTEYDIAENAWFSVDGQIPWAIASEAGQCDLLLISYLGIDFQSKGERYYRLTDYTMTFFDELPKAGETLQYSIYIESFIRSGQALFFNFGYDCFVNQKLVYKMTGGRAGFISDAELAQGKGIVFSRKEEEERRAIPKGRFEPLLSCQRTSFARDELVKITKGDIAGCLGENYRQRGLNPSLRFAAEEILMLDRIVTIDKTGGPWGLGEVVAEKDLAPDHWYFPCHFKDDNVLAGTLVTEGCVQLLGFYMLYLGLQVKTKDARFQPVKNRPYAIRARGQILPTDTRYSYKMEILEIGLEPHPYARANFYIIMNGKILVDFRDLGVELLEKSPSDPAYGAVDSAKGQSSAEPLFGEDVIQEFAMGSLANCFGSEFAIYDNKRGPRTPNGDLQLINRILELKGERHHFHQPSHLITEYDVPPEAWFFQQNSYPIVPYSIIMEIALQPCAFLSAYMGTTLLYPEAEMCFRNLSSTANLLQIPDLRGKTVRNKIVMTSVSKAAETVVMNFDYELICDGQPFYQGTTQFGYFTPEALNMQKGLDRGKKIPPWFVQNELSKESAVYINLKSPMARNQFYQAKAEQPFYRLAENQLDFLDEASVWVDQGKFGRGYVYGSKKVGPSDWFYPCHFYKDPVMPGSLGVEAILQAIKIFVLETNLGANLRSPRFLPVPSTTKWLYRGQITPDNETMDLEVHIKDISTTTHQITIVADANLWKNGLRIYEITDATIAVGEDTP